MLSYEEANKVLKYNPETGHLSWKVNQRNGSKAEQRAGSYLGKMIQAHGIRLKVNTVVNRYNRAEDHRPFILAIRTERWKIFQALPVEGQNDARIDEMRVTADEFQRYVERNRTVEDSRIVVVPESNELMTGSYVMVDPRGRIFDDTKGRHTYSRPILEVGIAEALDDVVVHVGRFEERGGIY